MLSDFGRTLATSRRRPLSVVEADDAISSCLSGIFDRDATAELLSALHTRREAPSEIEGCARAMLRRACRVSTPAGPVVDIGGTGGDGGRTFNVSTVAALVVAASGELVLKHGNHAVTGRCGSLDLLTALGVPIPQVADDQWTAELVERDGFAVAPTQVFHALPRHVSQARRLLPHPTVFDLASPLAHPARHLAGQVIGVWAAPLTEMLAVVLGRLGRVRATLLWGDAEGGGIDEPSLSGPTKLTALRAGRVDTSMVTPEDVGLRRAPLDALGVATAAESMAVCHAVLDGERGPYRDAVVFSAGICLWTSGVTPSIVSGVRSAEHTIDIGAGRTLLTRLTETGLDAEHCS